MDVSPPDNRSTSSGFNISNPLIIGLQPFGQSFGQTLQRAGSFHPSTPGPLGQHSGGPVSSNSFPAPGFLASGSSSNQPTLVPFASPNSFPLVVPFEANANQFNPNQSNPIKFNQSTFNQFNQSNPNSFNHFNTTSFNQPNPNQFNQSTPNQFNQLTPSQFNQSTPNQFNPSALSSPSASLASTPVVFTIGAAPPVKLDRHGYPVKNKSSRPMKKLLQRSHMKQWSSRDQTRL